MPHLTLQQAFDLALQHHQAGRLQDAEGMYRQILALRPGHAETLHNLGIALREMRRLDEAIGAFQQAIAVNSSFPDAHYNLGIALYDARRLEEAVAAFRQTIALNPGSRAAYNNLGNALKDSGQLDSAVDAYRHAIALAPNLPEAYNNLGTALRDKGEIEQAIDAYRQAIAVKRSLPEAHHSLAVALRDVGKLDLSIAACRQAIALRPEYADAHHHLALGMLQQGDFEHGWEEYEWRWKCAEFATARWKLRQPQWDGSDLTNRTILLRPEQGFGDTIQFARYVPLVAERGGKVIFGCDPELRRLLRNIPGIWKWAMPGEVIPPFDIYCPLLSLPRAFGTTLKSIPATIPYLFSDPTLCEFWKGRLAAQPATLRVGLAWAGRPSHINDRNRSMKLSDLASLMRTAGVWFFSLQKGDAARQITTLPTGVELVDWTNELHDFADTAALIANLDLVICVDTAVAHLAGAMGKPVWLMLPFAPDWRWPLDRNDSPWYPTMRLFRQVGRGNWESVIAQVVDALSLWIKNRSPDLSSPEREPASTEESL